MNSNTIRLRLNQQQLELIDKSIAAGEAEAAPSSFAARCANSP